MDNVNEIYVYENWKSDTPSLIGTLYVDGGRVKQVVSLEYDDTWLNDLTNNVTLDPDLRMFKGRQYAPADKLMTRNWQHLLGQRFVSWNQLLWHLRRMMMDRKKSG